MNCEKIKELILTDYSDGEIKESLKLTINQHLANCKECRQLAESLNQTVIRPLRESEKLEPPAYLWEKIKQSIIESSPDKKSFFTMLKIRLEGFTFKPKPVFATAFAMALIVISLGIVRHTTRSNIAVNSYISDQMQIYSYLQANNGSNGEYIDFGTDLENYFL